MRYFAILKDSLREALDSKLLIVLMILSTIVIAFVAAFSFQSLSAEDTMKMFFPTPMQPAKIQFAIDSHKPEKIAMEAGLIGGPKFRPVRGSYALTSVRLLRGEADAPESDYELIVTQHDWRHGDPLPARFSDPDAPLAQVREIFSDAQDLGFIRIAEITYWDGQQANSGKQYRVVLNGTPRTHRIWATQIYFLSYRWFSPPEPLGFAIYGLAELVLKLGSWVTVLSGVIITSFFIPNMLRKGSVDLLLAKPLRRWSLLTYKFLGGLTFVFLITAYSIGGIWLVIGLRSGLWANASLLLIFTLTFFFAILYAVSTFVGVLTRNAFVAIVVTVLAWAVFACIGLFHHGMDVVGKLEIQMAKVKDIPPDERWGDSNLALAGRILHAITPHTEDLNKLNDLLVFTSFMTGDVADAAKFNTSDITWWASLVVSSAWIILFLGFAAAWFAYKDY